MYIFYVEVVVQFTNPSNLGSRALKRIVPFWSQGILQNIIS